MLTRCQPGRGKINQARLLLTRLLHGNSWLSPCNLVLYNMLYLRRSPLSESVCTCEFKKGSKRHKQDFRSLYKLLLERQLGSVLPLLEISQWFHFGSWLKCPSTDPQGWLRLLDQNPRSLFKFAAEIFFVNFISPDAPQVLICFFFKTRQVLLKFSELIINRLSSCLLNQPFEGINRGCRLRDVCFEVRSWKASL